MVLMIVKSEIFRSRKFATVSMPRDYLSESENASVEVFSVKPLVLSENRACALDEKLRRCQQ